MGKFQVLCYRSKKEPEFNPTHYHLRKQPERWQSTIRVTHIVAITCSLFPVLLFYFLQVCPMPHAPCSLPLRFVPQDIPHPKHRMDQFFFKRLVNLVTEVIDIDLDYVGGGFEVDIPDLFGDLGF